MDTHAEDDYAGGRAPVGEFVPVRRGRGGFDPEADAIAREARYAFRQRTLLGLGFVADSLGRSRIDHLSRWCGGCLR